MKSLQKTTRRYPVIVSTFKVVSLALIVIFFALIAVMPVAAQSISPAGTTSGMSPILALLIVALLVLLLMLPLGYLLLRRSNKFERALLLVSTDEAIFPLVKVAAQRTGYNAVTVYRYEDALDKLRNDFTLSMIIVDDSVPQYEAGLLLSMLQRLPIGIRPLILIHDSSELGQTAPSYRAEAVVAQPVTEKSLETAIKQVSERIDIVF